MLVAKVHGLADLSEEDACFFFLAPIPAHNVVKELSAGGVLEHLWSWPMSTGRAGTAPQGCMRRRHPKRTRKYLVSVSTTW
jgi:hypothetical protein